MNTADAKLELQRWKEVDGKRTPGEWHVDPDYRVGGAYQVCAGRKTVFFGTSDGDCKEGDSEFAAHAANSRMAEALEWALGRIAELEAMWPEDWKND